MGLGRVNIVTRASVASYDLCIREDTMRRRLRELFLVSVLLLGGSWDYSERIACFRCSSGHSKSMSPRTLLTSFDMHIFSWPCVSFPGVGALCWARRTKPTPTALNVHTCMLSSACVAVPVLWAEDIWLGPMHFDLCTTEAEVCKKTRCDGQPWACKK